MFAAIVGGLLTGSTVAALLIGIILSLIIAIIDLLILDKEDEILVRYP